MTPTHRLPHHHLDEEALLGYASGALGEAESVLVATHLALCPGCRDRVTVYESLGGEVLKQIEPSSLSDDAFAKTMACLSDVETVEAPVASADFDHATLTTLPRPLRDYIGGNLDALPWKSRGRGVKELPVEIGDGSVRASLLRIRPGESIPQHTHEGVESTLVLKGAFSDETGTYARGDVAIATEDHDHSPVAGTADECICFAVIEGPLRFTGPIGRVLNLFVRP
jgi:putative transcriptional regulator